MVIHFQKVTTTQAMLSKPIFFLSPNHLLSSMIYFYITWAPWFYWLTEEAMTAYPVLVSSAVGELGFHCRWKGGCDKEPKLECSEVQWSEELARTFHWVLIRGTFQRVSTASQGLLQLSSKEDINIPLGLSGYCQYPRADFRRAHLKRGYNWLWSNSYPLDRTAE